MDGTRSGNPLGPGNRGQVIRSAKGSRGYGNCDVRSDDVVSTASSEEEEHASTHNSRYHARDRHGRADRDKHRDRDRSHRGNSRKATPRDSTPRGSGQRRSGTPHGNSTPRGATPRRQSSSSAASSSVARLGGPDGVAVQLLASSQASDLGITTAGEAIGSRDPSGYRRSGEQQGSRSKSGKSRDKSQRRDPTPRRDDGGSGNLDRSERGDRGDRGDRNRDREMTPSYASSSRFSDASGYSASMLRSDLLGAEGNAPRRGGGGILEYMSDRGSQTSDVGMALPAASTPRGGMPRDAEDTRRENRTPRRTPRSERSTTPRTRTRQPTPVTMQSSLSTVERDEDLPESISGKSDRIIYQKEGRHGITYGVGNIGLTPYAHDDAFLRYRSNQLVNEKEPERCFNSEVPEMHVAAAGICTVQNDTLRQQKRIQWGNDLGLGQRGQDKVEKIFVCPELFDGRVMTKAVPRYHEGICSQTHGAFKAPHMEDMKNAHTPMVHFSRHSYDDMHGRRRYTDITHGQEVRDGTGLLNPRVKEAFVNHHKEEIRVQAQEGQRQFERRQRASSAKEGGRENFARSAKSPWQSNPRGDGRSPVNGEYDDDDLDGPPGSTPRKRDKPGRSQSKKDRIKAANRLEAFTNHDRFYQKPPAEAYDLRLQ